MNGAGWRRYLPGWPAVPPRLWLTAGVGALAVINLGFHSEVWANTPKAATFWVVVLWVTGLVGIPQLIGLGLAWNRAYSGPTWSGLLFHAVIVGFAIVGALAWLAWGFVGLLVMVLN